MILCEARSGIPINIEGRRLCDSILQLPGGPFLRGETKMVLHTLEADRMDELTS